MANVLLALTRLPIYRRDFLAHLRSHTNLTVTYSPDDNHINPSTQSSTTHNDHELLESRLGPFRWQQGLFQRVGQASDFVIFTGDVRYLSTWASMAKARVLRIPSATWGHGWSRYQRRPWRWIRILFYRMANQMWVYTRPQLERAVSYGMPSDRVFIVGNATNDIPFIGGLSPGNLKVGFVGRLVEARELHLLVSALNIVRERGIDIQLDIVGTGSEESRLMAQAEDLGTPVYFHGAEYDDERLSAIVAEWAVCAIPAHAGLSVITALSQGCPVILSDAPEKNGPEWSAVEPGVNGVYFTDGSIDALADAIVTCILIENQPRMSAAARQTYEDQWSPDSLAMRMASQVKASLGSSS